MGFVGADFEAWLAVIGDDEGLSAGFDVAEEFEGAGFELRFGDFSHEI
jgi:hypothetical protein